MTCVAVRTAAFFNAVVVPSGLRCDKILFFLTSCIKRIGTGAECDGTICLTPGDISWIWKSIYCVPKSTVKCRFFTIPNQSLTCEPPKHTKRKIVFERRMCFFTVPRRCGTDWYLILADHFLQAKILLTVLKPAFVLRRETCGFN